MTEEPYAGKDRLPYALKPIFEFIRDNSRETDALLTELIELVLAALEDDGVIDQHEAMDILQRLISADQANSASHSTLSLLLEANKEAAQREMERIEAKRRKVSRVAKRGKP